MDWWQGYVDAALLGTDRRRPAPPKETNESDDLISLVRDLDWSQPEAALLSVAGVVGQYQQVGRCAKQNESVGSSIAPCEPDTQPCCSDRIAQYLGVAMQEYPEAVPELLGLMASMGQRVPPKWLPKLLSFGCRQLDLQTQIGAVLGYRGRWLAARNPDWRYGCVVQNNDMQADDATDSVAEIQRLQKQWQLGTARERCLALQQWRKVDSETAREALCESWKAESWRDREAFLSALATGLSLYDEDFLESALSDRAKSVRASAAQLLATLPESGLCQRMAERSRAFVRVYGDGRQLCIDVALPEQFEPDWGRDGIVKKPLSGEGERAGWVRQMLAKTPLSVWMAEPMQLAKTAAAHEWRDVLINGWAAAIQRQRSAVAATGEAVEWAIAWLSELGVYDLDEAMACELLLLLPVDRREAYLRSQLPKDANHHNIAHWLRLVSAISQRWDFAFSQLVLTQLMKLLKGKAKYGDLFSPPISLALSLHPGLAAQAAQTVNNLTQNQYPTRAWQKFLDRFLGLLSLRWEIYQAYADSS
ncbi:MAG: DUF5691 domain-containing protein [Cyanobacteria bacterium J06581_3]